MNLGAKSGGALAATFACLIAAAVWTGVSGAGPTTDTDADTVADYHDNCTGSAAAAANTTQIDSNGDGYGNKCDCDYDNNGACGATDLTTLKAGLNKSIGQPGYNPDLDSDGNNAIGATDLTFLKSRLNTVPGPSSCVPASNCI